MVVIRDARVEDRARLADMMLGLNLVEDAMAHDRTTDLPSTASHIDHLRTCVADQGGCILVAEKADRPVGFLVAYVEEDEGFYLRPEARRQAFVSDLFVEEAFRGQGVAATLMAAAEDRFRAMGIRRMQLSALAANRGAITLYEKLGYNTCAVLMEKTL